MAQTTLASSHALGQDASLGGLLLALSVSSEADSVTPWLAQLLQNAEDMFARFHDTDAATELVEACADAQVDAETLQHAAVLAFAGDSQGALEYLDDVLGNIG